MDSMDDFEIRPIRISEDGHLAVRFQIDAYKISFGNAVGFFEKFGVDGEGYIHWLRELEKNDPKAAVHIWSSGKIIGQIELGIFKEDASVGYVYLYYLVPEARGRNIGKLLDEYASNYFRSLRLKKMRLSVTFNNQSAIQFYRRLNWDFVGEDSQRPAVVIMEKVLE